MEDFAVDVLLLSLVSVGGLSVFYFVLSEVFTPGTATKPSKSPPQEYALSKLSDSRQVLYSNLEKSRSTAFILSLFLGALGIDRMYLGQVGLGVVKFLTAGGLGLWYLIDLFLIMGVADRMNHELVRTLTVK